MLEKVLVFIGIPVDPCTEREWDALLEASGYQAFFTASEWQDVDLEGCLSRAVAVRQHLKQYSSASEAIYVDQPHNLSLIHTKNIVSMQLLPTLPMPESASKLLDALDAHFATA